jgi:hypothetical protein
MFIELLELENHSKLASHLDNSSALHGACAQEQVAPSILFTVLHPLLHSICTWRPIQTITCTPLRSREYVS